MAKIFCPFCGTQIEDSLTECPNCKNSLGTVKPSNDDASKEAGTASIRMEAPGKIKCPGCQEEILPTDPFCSFCGYNMEKQNVASVASDVATAKKGSKKGLIIAIIIVAVLAGVAAFMYFASPKTATWLCSHNKKSDATCTERETCDRCGKEFGEPLGHKWKKATCTKPETCSVCGETKGAALGHNWKSATCTEPKTCKTCGDTDGKAAGHDWSEATCTEAKQCKVCGTTDGSALGHDFSGSYSCKRCGYSKEITASDLKSMLKVTDVTYKMNGDYIQQTLVVHNMGTKFISRVYFGIRWTSTSAIKEKELYVDINDGGLKPGYKTNPVTWERAVEFPGYGQDGHAGFAIDSIKILYSDGTVITITDPSVAKTVWVH